MLNDLDAIEIFISLYQGNSLSKTSEILNLEKSVVSRKLSKLELQLGRSLFDRTKRPFERTKDAVVIYPSLRKIFEEKQRVISYYRRLQNNDDMTIRVMFGNAHLRYAPKLIEEYADQFPRLRFEMISPPDIHEFMEGKADIISLSGQGVLTDCEMLPRSKMVFIAVASPEYVKKYGAVRHPSELERHRVYSNLYKDRYNLTFNHSLTKNGDSVSFNALDTISFNNVQMTHQAVLGGGGIGLSLPLFMVIEDLEAGRLVPVLNGWHRPCQQTYVACKKDDWKIRNIRLFATWWAQKLKAQELDSERRFVQLYDLNSLQVLKM